MKKSFVFFLVRVVCLVVIFTIPLIASAQSVYGRIKGKVVDKVTNMPLPGANIVVMNTDPMLGAASDANGNFYIDKVPVGRYNIKVMYVGYETMIYPELIVGSGKTAVVNAGLKESLVFTKEVVVSASFAKDRPLNDMVLVSGRSFSVEEARRYAGGIDDPARLASGFAGVTTGLAEDNGIVVRGNAPKGILWRLEGIEIPNPNHFFGMTSFGGGGVSALSSMMLANSDFLTGAFPAEYSNALSGVFDLKLKTGNTQEHEHTFQIGMMGIDMASEGPLCKKNGSSYALNYRYSTLGLVSHFIEGDMNIPVYQDLSFKLNFPTPNAGVFSLWGIGFLDDIADNADDDTLQWVYDEDRIESKTDLNMGTLGLSHKYIFGKNTYFHTTLAASMSGITDEEWTLNTQKQQIPMEYVRTRERQYILSSNVYHKFNARHYNKTGFSIHEMYYDIDIQEDVDDILPREQIVLEDGSSQLMQAYSQSDFRINDSWTLNVGANFQYFALNDDKSVEPRASIKWDFYPGQSLSLGYGLHSRLEKLGIYMAQQNTPQGIERPNMDMDLAKAHHWVLGYDVNLNEHTRLKIEPYFQHLFDVPVIADSSYSLLNMKGDWFFNQPLINTGNGTNYGVDLTLERYLHNHYYYLITASVFQSKYRGGDGVTRNTRFNHNYVVNVLGGKEWQLGRSSNKLLGINLRFQMMGGERRYIFDEARSRVEGDIAYDKSNPFETQGPAIYHTYVTFTYRVNKPGYSSIWALQLYNFPGSKDHFGYNYNYNTDKYDKDEVYVFFPLLSYKIEF